MSCTGGRSSAVRAARENEGMTTCRLYQSPRGSEQAALSARGDRFLERLGELLVHELDGETFLEIAHHTRLHLAEHDHRLQRRTVLGGDRGAGVREVDDAAG